MIKDSTMINNGDNEDTDESDVRVDVDDGDLVNGGGRGGDREPSSKSSLPGGCLTETSLRVLNDNDDNDDDDDHDDKEGDESFTGKAWFGQGKPLNDRL